MRLLVFQSVRISKVSSAIILTQYGEQNLRDINNVVSFSGSVRQSITIFVQFKSALLDNYSLFIFYYFLMPIFYTDF